MKACVLILSLLFTISSSAQEMKQVNMKLLIEDNLQFATSQYKLLASKIPATVMPRTFNATKGELVTSATDWWTSGFFPGTLWYLFESTGDTAMKAEGERRLAILEKEKFYTGNHDLGFMIFNSFGNAYRITGKPEYKEVVLTAAATLSKRYRPNIQSIQSWNGATPNDCLVIIDNMMNLELLCWSSQHSNDKSFNDIALAHSFTTIKNQYRPDFSSWHVVEYDLKTATIKKKRTAQGAADTSTWARGQVWGLYGYTMMYRMTGKKEFLEQARKVAAFLLNHPRLPSDKVPYWDFDAPGIPNALRDASAGAIMSSALLELGQYTKGKERKRYIETGKQLLVSLSSPAYRAKAGENGGFLLMHSVGSLPQKSEVDVPLTYADYYFIEANMRYKKWYLSK